MDAQGKQKGGQALCHEATALARKRSQVLAGERCLQKLAMDGVLGLEQLNQLIGKEAVLVITNEDHGQDVPLTVISEILPYTPGNLKGLSASGPSFRLSFAPDEDDSAMAA